MLPNFQSGDYVIALKIFRYKSLKAGDVVIINHPVYNEIIKRIRSIELDGSILLQGDGFQTTSSEKIGAVKKEWLIGKVYFLFSVLKWSRIG